MSTHTSSLTEKNSPSNQHLLEDKVTDLLGERDKLRQEIAQWHDLQEETIAKMNRHNSRLQEEMSKNTELRLERQRLLEENMFIEQKRVEAVQQRLLASSEVKDHELARYAMCKPLSEIQNNVECAIYYYNDLKKVYNDLRLRPEPIEENVQMTE